MTAKQYKKVIQLAQNGELKKDHMMLIFDNDGGYWICINPNLSEEDQIKIGDQYDKKYGKPDGYADLVELAKGAGINADWC